MITYRQTLGAAVLGIAAALAPARAQTTPPASPPSDETSSNAWVLGRTYGQVDASLERLRGLPGTSTGAAPELAANLPLSDNFDYGLDYFYEHAATAGYKLNENAIGNTFTGYYKMSGLAPFATVGFGYDWERTTQEDAASRYDHLFLDVATGLEVPVTSNTSVRATVANDDAIRHPIQHDFVYGLSANAWLNSALGTYVGADLKQGYNGEKDSVIYTAGFRFLFE